MQNANVATMDTLLGPADPLLALLRRVHEYRGPGYDPNVDRELIDLEPLFELVELELVEVRLEPTGERCCCGCAEEVQIFHLTEEGLAELVLHGRER